MPLNGTDWLLRMNAPQRYAITLRRGDGVSKVDTVLGYDAAFTRFLQRIRDALALKPTRGNRYNIVQVTLQVVFAVPKDTRPQTFLLAGMFHDAGSLWIDTAHELRAFDTTAAQRMLDATKR